MAYFVGKGTAMHDPRRTAAGRGILLLVGVFLGVAASVGAQETSAPAWQSMKPGDLLWMARQVTGTDDAARSTRQTIAAHLARTCLADTAATKSVSCRDWKGFVECLGKDLAAEAKTLWADRLMAAYGETPALVAGLGLSATVDLADTLGLLGQPGQVSALMERAVAVPSRTPADLSSLGGTLGRLGAAGKAARLQMIQRVSTEFLGEDSAARSLTCGQWRSLAAGLGADLTDEQRTAWAAKLRGVFGSETVLPSLSAADVQELTAALSGLGDKTAAAVTAGWAGANTSWQSMKPAGLVTLVDGLAKAGAAGKTARANLVLHVSTKYMTDAASVKSVSLHEWGGLVKALAGDLSVEARQAWIEKLRGTYGETAALTSLKVEDAQGLAGTLEMLGDKQAYALLAAWTGGTTQWQSLKPGDLATFAGNLARAGDGGKAARGQVAQHVAAKYLADEAGTRSLSAGQWKVLASSVAADLTADDRAAWALKLKGAFGGAGVLTGLRLEDARDLAAALAALGDTEAQGMVAAWVGTVPLWQTMKLADLVAFAEDLAKRGAACVSARVAVAQHVAGKFLVDVAATRSVACAQWRALAAALAKDLSPDGRQQWVASLRAAFAERATLVGLKYAEVVALVAALDALGDKQAPVVVATWTEGSDEWRSFQPPKLLGLARDLVKAGPDGKAARLKVADGVASACLGDAAAARSFGGGNWKTLIGAVHADLSPATRADWVAKLRAAYDKEAAASAKFDDLVDVGDALSGLGARPAQDVLIPYTEQSAEWRSFQPGRLAQLAGKLTDLGDLAAKPQLLVAQHVIATCLGGPTAVKAVGLDTWVGLTPTGRGLSPEDRQRWAGAITGAFLEDPGALPQKPAREVRRLVEALYPLDRKEAEALAAGWLTAATIPEKVDGGDLNTLAKAALRHEKATAESRAAIIKSVEVVTATAAKKPLDFGQCIQVMKLWNIAKNLGKMQEWTMKAYQCALGSDEARQSVTMDTLCQLGYYLYENELTHLHQYSGKGPSYPAFVAALMRHARQGTLEPGHIEHVSTVLATPETRQMLRDELLDSEGFPRLGAAKLLAWAYRDAGEMAQWRSCVERGLAGADGDAKAMWLVVKAFTETLVPDSPNALRRRRVLDAALAAAVSEPTKLVVLNEFADFYRGIYRPGIAADLMESVKQQFSSETAAAVGALQGKLRMEEAELQGTQARTQAAASLAQKAAQLGYYRKCLERANARGDGEESARLQTAIQALERELGK